MLSALQLKRIQSDIVLDRKKLPERDQLVGELVQGQEELRVCELELRQLERAMEDASNPNRLRLLPGPSPTHTSLTTKMDRVEVLYHRSV